MAESPYYKELIQLLSEFEVEQFRPAGMTSVTSVSLDSLILLL